MTISAPRGSYLMPEIHTRPGNRKKELKRSLISGVSENLTGIEEEKSGSSSKAVSGREKSTVAWESYVKWKLYFGFPPV